MSKITVANRKFLEEQVKTYLKEIAPQDVGLGSYLSKDDFISAESLIAFSKGIISGLVDVGNDIIDQVFFKGSNLSRAIYSVNLTDGRALIRGTEDDSNENQKNLNKVKDFLSIFETFVGSPKDFSDPTKYKPGKDLERLTRTARKQWTEYYFPRGRPNVSRDKVYLDLYNYIVDQERDIFPGARSDVANRIVDKEELKVNNFFAIAARARMSPEIFAVMILRPVWDFIKDDLKSDDLRKYDVRKLLDEVREDFGDELKYNKILKNIYKAFIIAAKVDPTGTHDFEDWYNYIETLDKTNDGLIDNSVLPFMAVMFGKYSLLEKSISKTITKVTNLQNRAALGLISLVIISVYDIIDPFHDLIPRKKLTNSFNNILTLLDDISSSKPKNEEWAFDEAEMNKIKDEIDNIITILYKDLQTGLSRDTLAPMKSKVKKFENLIKDRGLQVMSAFAKDFEVTNKNIETIKQAFKVAKGHAELGFDDKRFIPASAVINIDEQTNLKNEQGTNLLREGTSELIEYFNSGIEKYTKGWDGQWIQPHFRESRKRELEKIINAFKIKNIEDLYNKFKVVDQNTISKTFLNPTTVSSDAAKNIVRYKADFNRFYESFFGKQDDLKNKGLYTSVLFKGGISSSNTERASQPYSGLFYVNTRGETPEYVFFYGRAIKDNISKKIEGLQKPIDDLIDKTEFYDESFKPVGGQQLIKTTKGLETDFKLFFEPDNKGPWRQKKEAPTEAELGFIARVRALLKLKFYYLNTVRALPYDDHEGVVGRILSYEKYLGEKLLLKGSNLESQKQAFIIASKKLTYLTRLSQLDNYLYENGFIFDDIMEALK